MQAATEYHMVDGLRTHIAVTKHTYTRLAAAGSFRFGAVLTGLRARSKILARIVLLAYEHRA